MEDLLDFIDSDTFYVPILIGYSVIITLLYIIELLWKPKTKK